MTQLLAEPDQDLIDGLSASVLRGQISQLFALAVIQFCKNGQCPICGDPMLLYQIAVAKHGVPLQLDIYHRSIQLPCILSISESVAN